MSSLSVWVSSKAYPNSHSQPVCDYTASFHIDFYNASFTYDGDGKRVKSVLTTNVGTTTTYFVGTHYEVTHAGAGQANGVVTKYYYAGAQRIAMRKAGELLYILGDHLGSTSIVTDDEGTKVSEMRYKAWGEVRYESGATPTGYTYTGQYSYTADFGLMFYNARWYDPSLGRFAQADTIIPPGVQGLDRYAYVNNSPMRYTDPSGHFSEDEIKKYLKNNYGDKWEKFWNTWQNDKLFWSMLRAANIGDDLHAPTSLLGEGSFISCDTDPFCFQSDEGHDLYEYQGNGPYVLERNGLPIHTSPLDYTGDTTYTSGLGAPPSWAQPQYDYSQGYPVSTGMIRVVTYGSSTPSPDWTVISETNPIDIIFAIGTQFIKKPRWVPVLGYVILGWDALSYINEGPMRKQWVLDVSYVQQTPYTPFPGLPFDNPFIFP